MAAGAGQGHGVKAVEIGRARAAWWGVVALGASTNRHITARTFARAGRRVDLISSAGDDILVAVERAQVPSKAGKANDLEPVEIGWTRAVWWGVVAPGVSSNWQITPRNSFRAGSRLALISSAGGGDIPVAVGRAQMPARAGEGNDLETVKVGRTGAARWGVVALGAKSTRHLTAWTFARAASRLKLISSAGGGDVPMAVGKA